MKLREFVTDENIRKNVPGREHLAAWDVELTDADLAQLRDSAYLAKVGEEHKEMQAYNLARYGNAKYEPAAMTKRTKIPETHVWAYWALFGSRGSGLYS
jgi:hypothetical protein